MNAIIMAAGTSSRFAPLSYEKPKGLLKVKGEILIERQIRQLHEAGITDITVVVGYMAGLFDYLKEKFGVKIVLNEDYNRYNNTSSLIRVIDQLEDSYICSSDNYFPNNVFAEKPEYSYYSALYADGKTGEYCLTVDDEDNITEVRVGGEDSWYMVGHVFFNKAFSEQFRKIMKKEYDRGETRLGYWEDVYLRYVKELPPMKIRRYQPHEIEEFDSLDELRSFDEDYINDTGCTIFHNICDVLRCEEKDICEIVVLKNGMTNDSFAFTCKKDGRKYVYRHPGTGTETFINRDSEYFSMQVAKELDLDKTFVYMHPTEGWKISYYVENARILDYHNKKEMSQAMTILGTLHKANVQSKYDYRLWDSATDFLHKIQRLHKDDTSNFYKLHDKIEKLYHYAQDDEWPECLNHCDALAANFLIGEDGEMTLIDWEYSGQGDTAQDLGSFIACSDLSYDEALSAIKMYLGHEPTDKELRHYLAYTAIASYCWYLWAIYQEANAVDTGNYLKLWHDYAYQYYDKAIALYEKQGVLDRPYSSFANLIGGDVDSQADFKHLQNVVYRNLCRKENPFDKENLVIYLSTIFPDEDVLKAEINQIGGMSNKNFRIDLGGHCYVLRVPGNGSEGMVDRSIEEFNSLQGSNLGINPSVRYFDATTGIKLVDFVEDAETLNGATIQRRENMKKIAMIYRNLHSSRVRFKNEFNIFREIEKYDVLLAKAGATMYDGWETVRKQVMELENKLNGLGVELHPCHNDAVPENFIKSKDGKIYLIDWEYSGMNDPMADLAALFLESDFTPENQDYVLKHYFDGEIPENAYPKIRCYQILWDYLWSQWTVIKEARGDDFGTYGKDRYERAIKQLGNLI